MKTHIRWTNASVLKMANDKDPVEAMESRIRALALQAIDEGWAGPPFDPVELARFLKFPIEARSDIPDARTVPTEKGLSIEYNPLRPRARVRFSIAHEIAHSLFPDCAEAVRNRGGNAEPSADDWQLEVLCNIGAAELLMPAGSFNDLNGASLSIDKLLELRKQFDVSTEALLIRVSKLSSAPCAAFCASSHGDHYQLDYIIPSRGWSPMIGAGQRLPSESIVSDANAIGYTASGEETWGENETVHIECVALSPYPGSLVPRVVGLIRPAEPTKSEQPRFSEVTGDALKPRGKGAKIVAHVVPNSSAAWGGWGFAAQVRKNFPETWRRYRSAAELTGLPLPLGEGIKGKLSEDVFLFNMVSQGGIGPSQTPRIKYSALEQCLQELAAWAKELDASVHMPRIGTGHAGGAWEIIRELILDVVVKQGIHVTVYSKPSNKKP